jgi:hypothetical protein
VGICMCVGGLNLKQLSGFSFLNLVYLSKLNVAQWQMLNLCLVAPLKLNVAKWQMANAGSVPRGTLETECS